MMKKSGGLNNAMKAVGRNMARANNQKSGPKGYAKGGGVAAPKLPAAADMGDFGGGGMDQKGFGSGKARGGKSTKGRTFGGTF